MNLQQLRYVRETVRQGLNLTGAANALFTSQPGVSKQIRELELELGVDIFERRGKRFVGVTEPGKRIVAIAERVLQELDNLKQIGKDFADQSAGDLTIATTHTQARYALPQVVAAFRSRYPGVRLQLLQGNPTAIAQMVIRGEADIGIATEAITSTSWRRYPATDGTTSSSFRPGMRCSSARRSRCRTSPATRSSRTARSSPAARTLTTPSRHATYRST
jgi:LysR family transcriptional regulator, cys regulon transcriptional activator